MRRMDLPIPDDTLRRPRAPRAGRWVPIRTLGDRHRPRVERHLLELDMADRVRRFGHAASDDLIRRYAAQLDFERDQIFGVFDSRLRITALGHLAFDRQQGSAEFGISVSAAARHQGLGSELFGHAVVHARNRGVGCLHIHLARDNQPMLAIVRRAGAQIEFQGADGLARLRLPADTLGSQMQELLGHHAAEFDYRVKHHVLQLHQPR
jgi:ribosomal protein S18 acetylase RimI-like enzyme